MLYVGILVTVISSAMIGFGSMAMYKHGFSSVWGVPVEYPKWLKTCKTLAPFAFILGIVGLFWGWIVAFSAETDSFIDLMQIFGPIVACLVGLFASIILTDTKINKKLVAGNNAAALGALPVIQAIDAEVPNCKEFYLCTQGVAFYNEVNYCYQSIRFSDYQLGDLQNPKEVWAVCIYLCQKHDAAFRCKAANQNMQIDTSAVGAIGNMATGSKISSFLFTRK